MFTVIFHDKAKQELSSLPLSFKVKIVKLLKKLEYSPSELPHPNISPVCDGIFEVRATIKHTVRGLWVYQWGKKIFVLIFIDDISKKVHDEMIMAVAWMRLQEMSNYKKHYL
ncbi:type II toxin-antitoxin system RelE/ParE family toxin, partial [Escherichia coli]|nr:type II toxin-antitoxin system RelE/ParE family toxin [Escherichia coli]